MGHEHPVIYFKYRATMILNLDSLIQSATPLITTLISLIFTISVFHQYLQRRKIYQFIWGTGLLIFSLTTLLEFISEIKGWSIPMYRIYYVLIASLVAILGLGTIYLFNRRAGRHLLLFRGSYCCSYHFNSEC